MKYTCEEDYLKTLEAYLLEENGYFRCGTCGYVCSPYAFSGKEDMCQACYGDLQEEARRDTDEENTHQAWLTERLHKVNCGGL